MCRLEDIGGDSVPFWEAAHANGELDDRGAQAKSGAVRVALDRNRGEERI